MSINTVTTSLTILLCLSCFFQVLQAQQIATIKGGYIMTDQVFMKKDMKDIFSDTPEALSIYHVASHQKKVGDITIAFAAGTLFLGILSINHGQKIIDDSDNLLDLAFHSVGGGALVISGYLLAMSGVALATISLINYSSSASKYKQALQSYYWSTLEKNGYKKDKVQLDFNVSSSGMGLTYNF